MLSNGISIIDSLVYVHVACFYYTYTGHHFFTFLWRSGRLQLKQFPKFEARIYYLGLVIREHVVANLIVVDDDDDDDDDDAAAADDDDDDDDDDAADDDDDDDDDDAVCSYFCCASYDILLVLVVGRHVF